MDDQKRDNFIRDLQATGLNYEESMIYFTLLQNGSKGTYASELANKLNFKRTSMLSKLNHLVKKGCVHIKPDPRASRGVQRFAALSPVEFIRHKVEETRQNWEILEKIEKSTGKRLEKLFHQGVEYGLGDLDPFLVPYLSPLLEKGWKLVEQDIEKSQMSHGFDVYDCTLMPPQAQLVKDCGFMVFKFQYTVETDETTVNFITDLLLRRGAGEIFQKDIGVKDIHISRSIVEIFNNKYTSLKMEFLFSPQAGYQELTKSAIIPIGNQIFFLWGEDQQIVEEMASAIFQAGGIF
jgi:DNA-binding MarR family transcriptional regulator